MTEVMHATENGNGNKRRSILAEMAARYQMSSGLFEQTIKATVLNKNATNEELLTFLSVASQYDLNPFTREIFAFPGKGGGIQTVVSVDGWVKIINSHEQLDGLEFEDSSDDDGNLISITAVIWRKDRSHPITVTEYLSECSWPNETWKRWPHRMLRHKALIQCARYAFGYAGLADPDEAERMHDVSPIVEINPPKKKPDLKGRMEALAHGKNGDPKTPNGEQIDAETGEITTPEPLAGLSPLPAEGAPGVNREQAAGTELDLPPRPSPAATILDEADKGKLRQLHDALSFATGAETIKGSAVRWAKLHPVTRGSAIADAAAAIKDAHLIRVAGMSSPVDTDEAVARILG